MLVEKNYLEKILCSESCSSKLIEESIDSALSNYLSLTLSELNGLKFKFNDNFKSLKLLKGYITEEYKVTPEQVAKYFVLCEDGIDENDLTLFYRTLERLSLGQIGLIHWRSLRFLKQDELIIKKLLQIHNEKGLSVEALLFAFFLSYAIKFDISKLINAEVIEANTFTNPKNKNWKDLCKTYWHRCNQLDFRSPLAIREPLKIAFLISGQMRGYKDTLPVIVDKLVAPLNGDIFIHTWKQSGFRQPTSLESERIFTGGFLSAWKLALTHKTLPELKTLYPQLFQYLENLGDIDMDFLKNIKNTKKLVVDDAESHMFNGWTNAKCMHYKMRSCFDLASQYGDYDVYFRIRADKEVLNVDINSLRDELTNLQRNSIYFRSKINTGPFGLTMCDQFAFGDRSAMESYHDVYGNEENHYKFSLPGNLYQPHFSQVFQLFINNCNWNSSDKFIELGALKSFRPLPMKLLELIQLDAKNRSDTEKLDVQLINSLKEDINNEKNNS